jgi:hypothetical protein
MKFFVIITLFLIVIIVYKNLYLEHFAETDTTTNDITSTGNNNSFLNIIQNIVTNTVSTPLAKIDVGFGKVDDKIGLISKPITHTVNNIVDTLNTIPTVLYDKTVNMSKKIKGKIKEYGETMKSYNRTPDDCEGLRNLTINKRHKLFMDNIRSTEDNYYQLLVNHADNFYNTDYQDQDVVMLKSLIEVSKYKKDIIPFIKEKMTELLQ